MRAVQNAQLQFSGEVVNTSRKGNKITANCKFGTGLFESELPLLVRGIICPHLRGSYGDGSHLISQGCTGPDALMKKANWKFTANVAGVPSAAFPYALQLSTLAGVGASAIAALAGGAVFLNWFTNGWVEWGDGSAIQRRAIIGSTVVAGGALTITLHRYFSAIPVFGNQVTLFPGCDGQFSTCKAYDAGNNPTGKFGNQLNFGADPFMPTANPTVSGQPDQGTQGAKK